MNTWDAQQLMDLAIEVAEMSDCRAVLQRIASGLAAYRGHCPRPCLADSRW